MTTAQSPPHAVDAKKAPSPPSGTRRKTVSLAGWAQSNESSPQSKTAALKSSWDTGILDFIELVDPQSGRVFFHSEAKRLSTWGLPLEGLATNESDAKLLAGWCLHVDPSSKKKFYANEVQAKAQWSLPSGLAELVKRSPYLAEPKSYAIARQDAHDFAPPAQTTSGSIKAPTMRRMTLRMLIQTLTLDKVICDREAFRAFQLFAASYHAEENVLFYCVAEAFRNRGTKAVDVLGLDDLSKSQQRGIPRTQSHLQQIALDNSRAERFGTTLERVQMIREARAIYERFLEPGSPDWVCVDQRIIDDIQSKLELAKNDPKAPLGRGIFNQAQQYVFQNMSHDLLPRFLKVALAQPEPQDREEEDPVFQAEKAVMFKPDEVLRHHLLQLQKKPMASANATANAFRSLFPSPRYAIEGREGSGLHPDSLTHFDNINNDAVIAQPVEPIKHSTRKSLSLSRRLLRPFGRSDAASSVVSSPPLTLEQRHFSTSDISSTERRNTTGMNRGQVLSGAKRLSKTHQGRRRSKSDGQVDSAGDQVTAAVDLDAHVFSVPELS